MSETQSPVDIETLAPAPPREEVEVTVATGPPIFLVGERADRYRMAQLLDGRHDISCAPDSGLLTDLAAVARRCWPDLCHYGYPEQYWLRRVAVFFGSIQAEYAASRHLARWAAAAEPADLALVDRLFPRCQVVRVLSERRSPRSVWRCRQNGSPSTSPRPTSSRKAAISICRSRWACSPRWRRCRRRSSASTPYWANWRSTAR